MAQKDGGLEVIQPLRQQRVELNEAACIEVAQCNVMGPHVTQVGLIGWHPLRQCVRQSRFEIWLKRHSHGWGSEQVCGPVSVGGVSCCSGAAAHSTRLCLTFQGLNVERWNQGRRVTHQLRETFAACQQQCGELAQIQLEAR